MSNVQNGIFEGILRGRNTVFSGVLHIGKPAHPFISQNRHVLPIFLVLLQVTMQLCVVTAANFAFAEPETQINRTSYDI